MELYGVYHVYDIDCGFTDAVGQEELVTIFPSEDSAKEYCERWSNPHVYNVQTDNVELWGGKLIYRRLPDLCENPNQSPEQINAEAMRFPQSGY